MGLRAQFAKPGFGLHPEKIKQPDGVADFDDFIDGIPQFAIFLGDEFLDDLAGRFLRR